MKKILIKTLLNLHSFTYRVVSYLSIENGEHPKHRIMQYHQFFVDNVSPTDTILDVGCGRGFLTEELAEKSHSVIGIDNNFDNIDYAREHNTHKNASYIQNDAMHFYPDVHYNVIILSNILEHIENRIPFLKYYGSISDKMLIRVPMLNRDWITLYKKQLGLDYRLDNGHFTEYTLPNLIDELEQADLKLFSLSIQFSEIWGIVFRKNYHDYPWTVKDNARPRRT